LEFDARTAQKYIAIYRGKNEVASYLGIEEAYRLLSQPAQPEEPEADAPKFGDASKAGEIPACRSSVRGVAEGD
jgi:hypothetical protein